MRLFVALSLPEDVRERLDMLDSGLPGARWVAAENLHLTLRFLGEVDSAQARDLDDTLSAIDAPGFALTLQGLATFGDGAKVRALYADVAPNPALLHLQAKVESAVARAGLPLERRKFKPHVTLARFKGDPGPKLGHYLGQHGLLRIGPFPVDHFLLYSSLLGAEGPHYTEEVVYDLERVGVV
ncbi:RNA 2',3'-cyclic phosphodiesterase [Algihabitans albus]|uniref:RNA 2',3'-cyclic phosphodiesterase n=1 Tax=Algihabitans albus TaxID=2164067 RepID=UPI000E5D8127|nr:RNA 2',3'-cyclic phosphodiesterase [Algihabitans albus]